MVDFRAGASGLWVTSRFFNIAGRVLVAGALRLTNSPGRKHRTRFALRSAGNRSAWGYYAQLALAFSTELTFGGIVSACCAKTILPHLVGPVNAPRANARDGSGRLSEQHTGRKDNGPNKMLNSLVRHSPLRLVDHPESGITRFVDVWREMRDVAKSRGSDGNK